MLLCVIALYSIWLDYHHQTHPQLCIVSVLAQPLHSFWSYFCSQCPNSAAGCCWPGLCRRLPDTHRQVWLSLFFGHCSFLLGPGVQKVFFVPFKSLFPLFCGSSVIKFCWPQSQIPGASQSLCQIRNLRKLLWALELLQQGKNFFGVTVL